jgi:hypothetical protein
MKNFTFLFTLFLVSSISFGQVKKEIKKTVEVEVNEENGKTKTVIRTEENGKITEEVYEGEEAIRKADQARGQYKVKDKQDKTIEVEVKENNGIKTMTVKETENGKVKITKYKGKEVDKKLKELQEERNKE